MIMPKGGAEKVSEDEDGVREAVEYVGIPGGDIISPSFSASSGTVNSFSSAHGSLSRASVKQICGAGGSRSSSVMRVSASKMMCASASPGCLSVGINFVRTSLH